MVEGWHAPAGRRTREPRPLAQARQIRPAAPVGARNWDPAGKPVAGQPQRRRPDRRSGRVPGSDATPVPPQNPRSKTACRNRSPHPPCRIFAADAWLPRCRTYAQIFQFWRRLSSQATKAALGSACRDSRAQRRPRRGRPNRPDRPAATAARTRPTSASRRPRACRSVATAERRAERKRMRSWDCPPSRDRMRCQGLVRPTVHWTFPGRRCDRAVRGARNAEAIVSQVLVVSLNRASPRNRFAVERSPRACRSIAGTATDASVWRRPVTAPNMPSRPPRPGSKAAVPVVTTRSSAANSRVPAGRPRPQP